MFREADTIPDEEIVSIAQRLTDAGRPVSPVTVWSELRRGSIVSIAAALQRWRDARQPAMPAAQLSAEMPQEFAEALMNAAHRLRKASWDEAQSAIARRAELLSQRLDTALSERDEALAVFQDTQGEAASSRRQLEELMHGLRASEEAVARLQSQVTATTERADAAESRAGELAQRTSAQESELAAARLSLDEERRMREASRAELAGKNEEMGRIALERDEARQAHATMSQELERVSQEASAASARADTATAQANEGVARIAALEAELEAARGALAGERESSAAHVAEASARDEELQRVKRELEEARAELGQTRSQLGEARAELDQTRAQLGEARTELDQTRAQLGETHAQLDETRGQLDQTRAQLDETHMRVAAMESELSTQRETSAAHSAQASAAQEALQRVSAELEQARAQLHATTEERNVAQGDLARVTQDAAAAVARADEAQQHATTLAQQLAEREKSEAAVREELRDHKIALQTAGAAKEEEIAGLQRRISAQAQSHAKAYDELRANAEQWVTYARDLKQRLDVANEKILFIDARSTGEVALLRRLSTELERLKPDHELVFREAQQKVIGEKISQQLAQKGYRYDPATAVMSKIEG